MGGFVGNLKVLSKISLISAYPPTRLNYVTRLHWEGSGRVQHIKFVKRNRLEKRIFTTVTESVRYVLFLTYTNENALIFLTCTYIFLAGMLKAPDSSCVQEI